MPNKKFETYTIQSPEGLATVTCVPERGGALSSIKMGKRELLFQHDYFWEEEIDDLPGGLPFAFPVFARLERQGERGCYLFEGKRYYLPIHGFAWQESWQAELVAQDCLRLTLQANERTLQQYPFHFTVILEYQIKANELLCAQRYSNQGDQPMPYSAGFHPYFLTDAEEEVKIDFKPIKRFVYNEQLTDLVGEAELFNLPASIHDSEINEQLTQVGENKEIKLIYANGDVLHISAEGVEDANMFSFVQLYTIPEKPFFCAEPIIAPPNALNTVSGMRWLSPGESEYGLFKLKLTRI